MGLMGGGGHFPRSASRLSFLFSLFHFLSLSARWERNHQLDETRGSTLLVDPSRSSSSRLLLSRHVSLWSFQLSSFLSLLLVSSLLFTSLSELSTLPFAFVVMTWFGSLFLSLTPPLSAARFCLTLSTDISRP
ncbi:hypothetical protein BDY24DRAFT_89745 [Mrakia frigida]|uniref:uncharacterized protein n=1 Tax=Mrakia frigida TaxID=29902 RepID=UPI003FCC248A